jgi:hypothetical protein
MAHGCRHVAESVWARMSPGHITFVDFDGFYFNGWFCDTCLERLNDHGLEAYLSRRKVSEDDPPEEEMEAIINLMDLQGMCYECFRELVDPSFQEGRSTCPPTQQDGPKSVDATAGSP